MQSIEELVTALRVELGLQPDDDSQDDWITARTNAALASIRRYCRRWLWPASQFRDSFVMTDRWACDRCGGAVMSLAEIPVQQLLSIVDNGAPQDVTEFEVLPSGRLFRRNGSNLVPTIAFGTDVVDYVAGYVDLPDDLFEAISGMVQKAWSQSPQGMNDALRNADKVTIFDVGSVELTGSGGVFYEGSVKGWTNPVFGPWVAVLEPYRDYSRGVGLPVSRESIFVGAAPATAAKKAAA
jgi:hypothetical protein